VNLRDLHDPMLEAACLEHYDEQRLAVYGDWFEERGHPRGRLIALQRANLFDEAKQWLDDNANILGPSEIRGVDITWLYGFWRRLGIRKAVDVRALLDEPSARMLRDLVFHAEHEWSGSLVRGPHVATAATLEAFAALLEIDATAALPAIERLQLGSPVLRLTERYLDARQGATIASIPNLQALHISGHYLIQDAVVRGALLALAPLATCLVTLEATNCSDFDDNTCTMLSTFRKLEALYIRSTAITRDGLAELATLPRLRSLDVSDCRIDDGAAEVLSTFPALETVVVNTTLITAAGVRTIARGPKIRRIVVDEPLVRLDIPGVKLERG
jgi:hypothetical protein